MIVFKTIRWKNFLATGNVFTEVFLDKTKTTLVVGENGAGKSTLTDALTFALYGKAFRDVPIALLINSITNKQSMVELEFTTDGQQYLVRRGQKPAVFEIYCNGELIDQDAAAKDYQRYLEKDVLKMNYKSFKQIVVLGKANYKPFMELKVSERAVVIEDVIDINIFTVMASLNQRQMNLLNDQLRMVDENLVTLKNELSVRQQYLVAHQADVEQLVDQLTVQMQDLTALRGRLEREIEVERELNSDRIVLITDQSKVSNMLKELSGIENSIKHRIGEYRKEIQFYDKHETCPTCEQEIDEHFKKNTVQQRAQQMITLADGVKEVSSKINEQQARLDEITSICNSIHQTEQSIREKQQEITFVTRQMNHIQEQITAQSVKGANHENQLAVAILSRAIRNDSQVREILVKEGEVDSYVAAMLRDDGIKAKTIKKYIPIINELINEYLNKMNFYINFEIDENFNETIKSTYKDRFVYNLFSEGEKLRINLAILFTWREIARKRNSVSTNLMIMDEIFESSLDDAGVEDFLNILEAITGDQNIFVISHKTQMFDKFRGAIRFEKKGNFSRIAADGA